jgi:hypothetical protein
MKNYSTKMFAGMTRVEVRDAVYRHYKDVTQKRTVKNIDTGIIIHFNAKGRRKTASLFSSLEKAVVIIHISDLLKDAKRIKTKAILKGSALSRIEPDALCVINYAIKCKIDGLVKKFVCGVVLLKTGKFQYSLYHNEIRAKK